MHEERVGDPDWYAACDLVVANFLQANQNRRISSGRFPLLSGER